MQYRKTVRCMQTIRLFIMHDNRYSEVSDISFVNPEFQNSL